MRPATLAPLLAVVIACTAPAGDDADASVETSATSGDASSDTGDTTEASSSTGETGETTGDPPPVYDGEPLPLSDEWTWVEFPEARCRTGEVTGVAVRRGSGDGLMVYMQGGGACFNVLTCATNPGTANTADFEEWRDVWGDIGIFNQKRDDNPVADWNMVYIPYCSGDVFAGLRDDVAIDGLTDPQDFRGNANIGAFLDRIVPTFREIPNVLVAGASAGGFGAGFNFSRFAEAFPKSQVTLLDDSAPIMGDDYVAPCLQQQWRDTWNFAATIPAACEACSLPGGGGLTNLTTYLAERHPNATLGLISSVRDATISIYYAFGVDECSGFGNMSGDTFQAGLYELRDNRLIPSGRWSTFFIPGNTHVWTQNSDYYNTVVAGVALTTWLEDLLLGEIQQIAP
jgi:hypothetical protein